MLDAAVFAAREAGLPAEDAEIVSTGTHVLVRMGAVVARVTGDGALAEFAGSLEAEVRGAGALHAAGAPVVPPLSPRVHRVGEREVTLWRWWDVTSEDAPEAIGRALAECHRALAGVDVELGE